MPLREPSALGESGIGPIETFRADRLRSGASTTEFGLGWIRFLFRWTGRSRGGQLIVWSFGVGLLSTLASMALVFAFLPRDPVLGGWPADAKFWSIWSLGQLPGWVATASL